MATLIGLTGGIGSGKSTVAALFELAGATVIDTDVIAQQLTASGGIALPAIASHFGRDYVSDMSGLERAKMRARVFSDQEARVVLESILHPLIQEQVERDIKAITGAYGIIVVPLLFETMTYRRIVQRTLVADCAVETQIKRVMERSGLTRKAAESIIAAQIPRSIRLQLADDVICNQHDTVDLRVRVKVLHPSYVNMAA
jgi:dephospho-CoA kinase